MRVDTTVVETNVHYPTDSRLLGDGVRVLTRIMNEDRRIVGEAGAKLRDRGRGVGLRITRDCPRGARQGSAKSGQDELAYGRLLNATGRVVGRRSAAQKRSPLV